MTQQRNGNSEAALQWRTLTEDFETLAVTHSSDPSQFASRCIVPPIITSSIFEMGGAITVATPYALGSPADAQSSSVRKLHKGTPGRLSIGEGPKVYEYGRFSNPTRELAKNLFAKLEGAKHAQLFGSGTAAVASVAYLLKQGDHLISTKAIYSGSLEIYIDAARFGVTADFVTSTDVEDFVKLIRPNTKLITLETPGNPTLGVIDIAELVRRVRQVRKDVLISVDNTFLTPLLQRPLELGADLAIYSCSKALGGHGDIIMGAITTNSDELNARIAKNLTRLGGIPSPFDCYLLIRSLKTLPLRMKQHSKNGLKVARFLETHPQVERVVYPGLKSHPQHDLALRQQHGGGGLVGVYVKGGFQGAATVLNSTKVIVRAASLGADCSLASIPAKLSHNSLSKEDKDQLGIADNYIRLSLGLESSEALIKDLDQALNAITAL